VINGYELGHISAQDLENDIMHYFLLNENSPFEIDSLSGVISVADSSLIDYETDTIHELSIYITDFKGGNREVDVIVYILDERELLISDSEFDIDEFTANGTLVGELTATHAEGAELSLSVVDEIDNFPFLFSEDEWTLTVADSSLLNYDSVQVYSFRVAVESELEERDTFSVVVNILAVEQVIQAEDLLFELFEHPRNGVAVDTVYARERNGAQLSFSIINADNVPFEFQVATDGVLYVSDSAQIDSDLNPRISFEVLIETGRGMQSISEKRQTYIC